MPPITSFVGDIIDDRVFIYIERFSKDDSYILFDFLDSNEFTHFNSLANLNYNWQERPTMVEVLNFTQKKLQEGVVYGINPDALQEIINEIEVVEDSLLIGFRIVLKNNTKFEIGPSISFSMEQRFIRHIDDDSRSKDLPLSFPNLDKVIIRNVGQGNWNEIKEGENFRIVFDCGTIYTTKRNNLQNLTANRNVEYQKSKPILILSHWDVDHYHCLLGFHDDTIKSIESFIYRSEIPNLTARKALGRFRTLNPSALIPVVPANPTPRRSSKKLQVISLSNDGSLLLYNSAKNRSRNKCALGLVLRKSKANVVFSGDYDYEQISDDILPGLNYSSNHFLVVPHHGGNAGKFVYHNGNLLKVKEAIISVGKNPYKPKHPHNKNIDALRNKGFKVIRTDIIGEDYEFKI